MKRKLQFYLLSFIILFASAAQAQQGSIKGKIVTVDGEAAAYVSVGLKNKGSMSVTNLKGEYSFPKVKPGTYTIHVTAVGLRAQDKTVTITAGETSYVDFTLSESLDQLREVIVSSSRNKLKVDAPSPSLRLNSPLIEIPQNIQIVSSAALVDQQIISMSDGLIRNVSGVTRAEHWGDLYTNLSARGSQIQAFRNGFNVVNSYWGPLTEDMSFVDHVEFVKGPAGFMLSSGDPSGLYNVVTKKPTGIEKGEFSLVAGSFGLLRSSLDLDGKLGNSGKLLYRLNVSGQNKKSFRANEYNDRYAIAPVVSYQLDEKTKLTLEYNYQRANMSNLGSFYIFSKEGYRAYPVDFTTLPAGLPGTKINDHSIYLNLQHQLSENWKVTAQAARFIYDQAGSSMWPSDTAVYQDGRYIRSVSIWDAKSNMTMAQTFLNGEFVTGAVRHKILAGLDISNKEYMADWGQSHNLDSASNPFDPQNPRLGIPITGYPQFDRTTPLEERAQQAAGLQDQRYTSIYIQDELGFLQNRLRLTLALRYTDLQQSTYGGEPDKAKHLTPRIGVNASVSKNLAVYALYDQAFVPQTGLMASGGKVQPITGNNMELGVKTDLFGWTATLAAYRILKKNELTADPSQPNSGLSIELGEKRAQGIEFDIRGNIARGLDLVANYAYTDSKVSKVAEGVTFPEVNSIVPGFAKHVSNAWLTYKVPAGLLRGAGISAGYTWLADRATYWTAAPDPTKELEDYFKLDGGLFWENDKLKITANVFNVLNKYIYSGSYEDWMLDGPYDTGNPSPVFSYQAEAPRNYRLSLTYRF